MPGTLQKALILALGLLTANVHGHESSQVGRPKVSRQIGNIQRAKRLAPAVERRATFYGGWALAMSPCPNGLEGTGGECCPKGTFAHSVQLSGLPKGVACCPDEESTCGDAVSAMPICADTSWYLWVNDGQWPFCCLQGDIGYVTTGGVFGAGSMCSPGDVNVPQSIRASSMQLSVDPTTYTGSSPKTTTGSGSAATATSEGSTSGSGSSGSAPGSGSTSGSGSASAPGSTTTGSSLSTGAIVGIVIGAIILLVAIAVVFFMMGRRKSAPNPGPVANPPPYMGAGGVGGAAMGQDYPEPKPNQGFYPPATEVDGVSITGAPNPAQVFYPPVPEVDGVSAPGTPNPVQNQYYPPVPGSDGRINMERGGYRGELSG